MKLRSKMGSGLGRDPLWLDSTALRKVGLSCSELHGLQGAVALRRAGGGSRNSLFGRARNARDAQKERTFDPSVGAI